MIVFVYSGLFWIVAGLMGMSRKLRLWILIAVLLCVILLQFLLPDESAIRQATGGSAAPWLLLLGGGVLIALYRFGLGQLRSMAVSKSPETPVQSSTYNDTELERYARHIVLREIGGAGQKRLKSARVLVIGAGGLGAPVLQYLAAAGVGTIGVIDHDVVDNSNLQRQVIHREDFIGEPKVYSAKDALNAQNSHITILPYKRRFDKEIAHDLVSDFDIVIDGCDNFETRYLVNETCVALAKPLVSGALSQWEGQISIFDPSQGTPCYQCIFPQKPAEGLAPSCAEAGVFAPLPGVVGSMMAAEAMKLIIGGCPTLLGEIHIYDALYGEGRKISIKATPDCPICGHLNSSKHAEIGGQE